MTTVVDPAGTPTPVYNRSGTAIVSLAGGATSGSTVGSAIGDDGAPISSFSQMTVALVATSFSGGHHNIIARLPADAEIGDLVEVYVNVGGTEPAIVFPNAGEAIGSLPTSTGSNHEAGLSIGPLYGAAFRKVSSTQWMLLGSPS